ncbi:SGNH/GDSL hydrolase family protein [Compostibacter hankyongensis]|uniref:SGNH/GDSL hydrolase family protein n=1 Tax=Compostibacter hankyongensis TaxID=1007089 RepID=A0ABP8FNE1_9BACT
MTRHAFFLLLSALLFTAAKTNAQADSSTYLQDIKSELVKQWPHNRTINLVFHGHSVPSGYAHTPLVKTLEAYPHQVLRAMKARYPYAVINVITTSIGGENSVQGEKRFKRDVLTHHPDVLFIDYALNDRSIGLEKARKATERMIRMALRRHIKIILLTPSPDLTVDITKDGNVLEQYADQLIRLSAQYHIGLADSYGSFKTLATAGEDLKSYMAQSNHPNRKGHAVIAAEIMKWLW